MKKSVLFGLLAEYDAYFRVKAKNPRIILLENFLQTPAIEQRSGDSDISFDEFSVYLRQKSQDPDHLFSRDYFASKIKSTKLFIAFKFDKKIVKISWQETQSLFKTLPKEIRHALYANYLTVEDIARLARTASIFNEDTKTDVTWRNRLDQECDPALLAKVRATNTITDFKKLYKGLVLWKKDSTALAVTELWQLLCLSGDQHAIQYAIQNKLVNMHSLDEHGHNPAHYCAISGDLQSINLLFNLGIDPKSKSHYGTTALHFAAWGGNIAAMRFAIEELKIDPKSKNNGGTTALHFAALGGSIAAMRFTTKELGIGSKSKNNFGITALHYAAWGGNIAAMRFAIEELKIDPKSKNNEGITALHFAAWGGSIAAMRFAIEELQIDPKSKNNEDITALHFAAWGGNIAAMRFAIEELQIDPKSKNNTGATALHFAAWGGKIAAIRFAIEELNIDLYLEGNTGCNLMFYALRSKNPAIIAAIIQLGFEITHRDSRGRTALDYLNALEIPSQTKQSLLDILTKPLLPANAPTASNRL